MEYRTPKPTNQSLSQRVRGWFRAKIQHIDVHYAVYMFTPVEKIVFWSVLFLLVSLTTIATVLYLPQHLSFIISRAWFYAGIDSGSSAAHHAVHNQQDALSLTVKTAANAAAQTAESVVREL